MSVVNRATFSDRDVYRIYINYQMMLITRCNISVKYNQNEVKIHRIIEVKIFKK